MAPSAIEIEAPNVKYMDVHAPLHLKSSGGIIESPSIGRLRPTPIMTAMEEIRKRYDEEGYVWLKGLLPSSDVWNARREYFELFGPTGLIKSGSDPKDGVYCGEDWHLVSLWSN